MVATLFQRPEPISALVEPDAPGWAQRMALKLQGYFQPRRPVAPVAIWYANKVDLPPPNDWVGCLVVVPDQNCLAVSKGGQWLKIVTGGPV